MSEYLEKLERTEQVKKQKVKIYSIFVFLSFK